MSGTTSDRPQYQLMLSEVGTIRPAAVILWKTDRLGRDHFELADAKRRIRDAECRICLTAEPTPDDSPESVHMETMMEGLAEFYSRQLSVNIRRGMTYITPSMPFTTGTRCGATAWMTRNVTWWMTPLPRSFWICLRVMLTGRQCSPSATILTLKGFGRHAVRSSASRP